MNDELSIALTIEQARAFRHFLQDLKALLSKHGSLRDTMLLTPLGEINASCEIAGLPVQIDLSRLDVTEAGRQAFFATYWAPGRARAKAKG
jgi:hypothetical protein